MALVPSIHQAGLHSAIPAASASNNGVFYYETDTQKLFRSNGSAWVQVAAGTGQAYDATAIDGTGTFKLSGDISPSQITSDQNDYNPTNLATSTVLRLSSDASRNITGLQGGADGRIIVIVNVGSNAITLKDDDGATSTAGNRFALSGDVVLAADDGVILQYDSTSSRWRCIGKSPGGAGGSGAATTNEYVTTAAAGDLSAEVNIPGLAGSADISGAAGAGVSHEFDTGASPLTWSAAVDVENVDSTVKSHLYVQDNGAAETLGTYSWSPAGAFDIRCKISLGAETGTSTTQSYCGLIVGDSAMNNRVLVTISYLGTSDRFQVDMFTYASGTYTQRGATNVIGSNHVYLRIKRDGSNNNSCYYSLDGITWQLIETTALTYTAAKAGLRFAAQSIVTNVAVDWIRSNV